MRGQNPSRAWQAPSLRSTAGQVGTAAEQEASADSATDIDVERWAHFVAGGLIPLPDHLELPATRKLIQRVAQLRRQRLLKFIARVIAADIVQSRDSIKEHKQNAKAKYI